MSLCPFKPLSGLFITQISVFAISKNQRQDNHQGAFKTKAFFFCYIVCVRITARLWLWADEVRNKGKEGQAPLSKIGFNIVPGSQQKYENFETYRIRKSNSSGESKKRVAGVSKDGEI